MAWKVFRWVWRLKAPLFIGMPPAGALNRCRTYVPARVLWGAVTAELSRFDKGFPDYGKRGSEIAGNCRFTYLYPTEKRDGKFLVWLPKYEKAKGILWRRQDGKESLPDRIFRRRLLDSRPGTAISPESDSALEGSLRETECIHPWWRVSSDHPEETLPILLLGYVFLQDGSCLYDDLHKIDTLFVGGDTRYGLGEIHREGDLLNLSHDPCAQKFILDKENPEIKSEVVWGHVLENAEIQGEMRGAKELLGGWDYGSSWKKGFALAWAPGSFLEPKKSDAPEISWSINDNGYWEKV